MVSFLRMSSVPASASSGTAALDWRALRATVERGMLRAQAARKGRLRRMEDLARNGRPPASHNGKPAGQTGRETSAFRS